MTDRIQIPKDTKLGVYSAILGVLSILFGFFGGILLGIIAVVLASKQNKIQKTQYSKIGMITGIIGIFIGIPGVLIFLIIMSFSIMDDTTSVSEPGTVHIDYNSSEQDSLATQIIPQEYHEYLKTENIIIGVFVIIILIYFITQYVKKKNREKYEYN